MDYHLPQQLWLHYLAKNKRSAIQLYIYISENNSLHLKQHLFCEFLSAYFVNFLSDPGVILSLLRYFVCCITQPFNYQDKRLSQRLV